MCITKAYLNSSFQNLNNQIKYSIIFHCFKTVLSILRHALFVNSQNGSFILIFLISLYNEIKILCFSAIPIIAKISHLMHNFMQNILMKLFFLNLFISYLLHEFEITFFILFISNVFFELLRVLISKFSPFFSISQNPIIIFKSF